MRSSNPVFARTEGFNGRAMGANPYANPYGQTDPSSWGTGGPQAPYAPPAPMTIDSVVQKSAIAIGLVMITAVATWVLTPSILSQEALGTVYMLAMLGAGAAFVLSLVNSFKKVVSPGLVLAFCAAEGVALGAISKAFDAMFGDAIVMNAVLGTFAAFAGTLFAYKFFNIQVGQKFRTFTISAMFGMVGLGLLSLVLRMFGVETGLFGLGGLGLITAIVGLVLGVFMLILDFDFIERGVAGGIAERESWRAAFGLTVSLVWIYINLLRILAIFSQD
ncbi:Bax inhibitor-1/YccA family protein [Nocardioides limicola]|uniref:Bax inhibitor-1/YccA family protein n=1 Tax=Nocardioides limicola TaxID=2803368 RepID=UPI00193BC67C|nr:Bax inhibitor-1/YccA family protein [Nocardioides sp. DJM-14]